MKKDLTIYFDTSFYINLLRAEDELAFFAIEEFNKLKVRHVLSDVLVRELLSNSNSSGQDAILFERILRFTSPPYVTNDELNWEFLLEEGEDRETVARIFSELDGMLTLAHSFASVARRKKSSEEELKLEENTKPLLRQLGFPEDFTDVGRTGKAGIAMLRGFGLDVPEEFEFDNPTKLSEQLLGLLNTNELEFAKNDQMLKSSSTNSDDRTFSVAIGEASDKTRKKLSNDFRDTDHMSVFSQHRSQIDYLQIDSIQEKRLKTTRPPHFLVEIGLAEKCFSAASLQETIERVKTIACK